MSAVQFGVREFLSRIGYTDQRPDHVSAARWAAMIRWWANRAEDNTLDCYTSTAGSLRKFGLHLCECAACGYMFLGESETDCPNCEAKRDGGS